MSVLRRGVSAMQPLALQVITLSNSTAVGPNSTSQTAHALHLSVETNNIRYRSDGTSPALTTGVLLQANYDYWFWGYNGTSLLKFQRSTGTAKVTIQPYKYDAE